jgi:hypothetical protein
MRRLIAALVLAAVPFAVPTADAIDDATRVAVAQLATRGFADPTGATIRNLRKSLARNGLGYCGEVSLPEGGFTAFHAILGETGEAGSVIRLSEFPASDESPTAVAVRQMMKNVGCVE